MAELTGELIVIPLTVLMFFGVVNILLLVQSLSYTTFSAPANYTQSGTSGQQTLNGNNSQSLSTGSKTYNFGLGLTTGFLIFLTVAVAIGVASGITILGSGLSGSSVMIIFKSTVFFMMWGFCSALGIGLIVSVPVFGYVIYLILTLLYSVGVILSIGMETA
jgi:hypothetical protein